MKSWPELGALSFVYPIIPHPTPQEKMQLECVETNLCISQGHRLVNLVLYHSFSRVIWLRGRVVEH